MNSLIVLAHPEPCSYNAALAQQAAAALAAQGHAVRISDLYAKRFVADEHARHFERRKDPLRFDAQAEQRHGGECGALPRDVAEEIEHLLWADFVLLQFPLWWFGVPAILKGWMDRVFAYGTLYAGRRRFETGVCRGKRAMLSLTAGSSAESCMHDGREGDTPLLLWPVHYTLHYVGFEVLEPFIVNGVRGGLAGAEAEALQRHLDAQRVALAQRLGDLEAVQSIPFNRAEDYDAHGKLRPEAPVYSPFIRHRAERVFD